MFIKKYKIALFITTFIIISLVTTAVFAINTTSSTSLENKKASQNIEDTIITQLVNEFQLNENDMMKLKNDLKEWKKVYQKLLKDKRKQKAVSETQYKELTTKGYSLFDINKAEEYSTLCEYSAEEILQAKGNERNFDVKVEKDAKGNEKRIVTDKTKNLWDSASKKLKIDFLTPASKLGISDKDIKSMQSEGMTSREIFEIGMMAVDFNKDYNKVWSDYKTGITVEELEGKYIKEVKGNVIIQTKPNTDDKTKRDTLLKSVFKITDQEVAMFTSKGITEYLDMANAKHYAAKNNISVDKVIEMKKSKGNWEKVSEALGGEK